MLMPRMRWGSAVADQADPMQQLEDLGDTEDHAAKRRKQVNMVW